MLRNSTNIYDQENQDFASCEGLFGVAGVAGVLGPLEEPLSVGVLGVAAPLLLTSTAASRAAFI